jgi:dTDP-4-amino-4,6-dideoxygalactose transaminase
VDSPDGVNFSFRMTDLEAGIGLVQLGRLPAIARRRRCLAARTKYLEETPKLVAADPS